MNTKPIQLNITIQPPAANGKRKVVVSGAPEGEMPHILTGEFSQMHALLDQTYVALLKRDPQVVKVKNAESGDDGTKRRKNKSVRAISNRGDGGKRGDAKPDQLDRSGNTPETNDEELPVIEGDTSPETQPSLSLETLDNG